MTTTDDQKFGRPQAEQSEIAQLMETFRRTAPNGSRRDFMRWGAAAAGAVATAQFGVLPAMASPASRSGALTRYQEADVQTEATINVPLDPYGQAVTLDPHRTVNWGPFWVLFPNIWGGLVRFDEFGKVQLDLAESFTVNDDRTLYTFKIRPDAKYANGNPVLADHFLTSWKRALDPTHLSPMAPFMSHVRNYVRYTTRRTRNIGFGVADDLTLRIRLEQPYSYFLSYLAAFVWSVVDPAVVEAEPEAFWLNDAGTGPWRVTEFDPATQLVMEPNTNYYGGVSPSITKVVWPFVTGPSAASTALNLYKQDQAISADVPLSLKSSVERDTALAEQLVSVEPSGSTRSIAMDFKQEPFNDVRVRRAFALAIDRDAWANQIWEGTWSPTNVFTPPVVNQIAEYQPPEGLGTNLDEARQLLEDAGFPNGEGLSPITYYEPAEDTDDEKSRWTSFFTSLEDALGVRIEHNTENTLEQINDLQQDNGGRQFDIVWWWNVTETPHLLSEVFASESPYMKGVFNWDDTIEPVGDFDPAADATQFNELVQQADLEPDAPTRNDLYRQAEELVLRNAVYIPLGNWKAQFVQKPWIQGTKQGPWTGRIPIMFDKDVVVLQHDPATPEADA